MEDETRSIRWGVMILLLVIAFTLEPLFGSSFFVEILSLGLFELTIVGTLLMSAGSARLRLFGGALALIWFALSLSVIFGAKLDQQVAYLSLVLIVVALISTFRILMRRGQTDMETLLGAVFGYLLLAMAWAMLFVHIERWHPGSFSIPEGGEIWPSLVYYSLVTLSTLGYGDILPVTSLARLAAGFEAVIGVLYIAVMVGSIVGNIKPRQRD